MPDRIELPSDIESLMAELRETTRKAEDFVASAAFAQLTWREPGGWTVGQCLDHLAKTNFLYSNAIREAVTPAMHIGGRGRKGPIRPGWLTRKFIERMEPGSGSRFKAPDSVVPPPEADARTGLKDFLRAQRAVVSLLEECWRLDLNRIRFRSPFATWLRLSAGGGFKIIAAHNRRHLAQAARIIEAAPRTTVATSGR